MATLQPYFQSSPSYSPKLIHFKTPHSFSFSRKLYLFRKFNRVLGSRFNSSYCQSSSSISSDSASEVEKKPISREIVNQRPPFDINLAVVLAGFAFEAYTTPLEKVGNREMDAAKCQTVFLSETFLREIYDGQLFVKLKRGFSLPAMDPWGTSDPYVILQLDCQVVKSKVKWGTKEPTWNEEFALNIKQPPIYNLQVATWDANLVTPHKRMGNAGINLENLCDGNSHEVVLDLEGMGGGGKIELEIKYKSFEKIDDEKKWWKIPIITEFLEKNRFEPALKMIVGSESVQAREFVQFAFGQLKSINDSYLQKDWFSESKASSDHPNPETDTANEINQKQDTSIVKTESDYNNESQDSWPENLFWKNLADSVNQNVVQKLGLSAPEKIKWDGFDLLKNIGLQSREIAEANYVESGLATPDNQYCSENDELAPITKEQTL